MTSPAAAMTVLAAGSVAVTLTLAALGGREERRLGRPGVSRTVHVRDVHGRRVLAPGIVTILGTEGGSYHVRDAEPHEAARVLCSEETWQG
ncbi:hypothetical protein [Nonomuraea sp. NPDC050202]|uniref:hypothetical protein n=1 Tax=Nonomuraea sp. NPDC050202 TaxID=3155035 RepID=UPI0033E21C2B